MSRSALPKIRKDLLALKARAEGCPVREVYYELGRAQEAMLALGAVEDRARAMVVSAQAVARETLAGVEGALVGWERQAGGRKPADAASTASSASPPSSPDEGLPGDHRRARANTKPAKARRPAARRAA